MKKAVISDRIYISGDYTMYREIKNKLTYTIPATRPGAPSIEYCDVAYLKNIITIPVGRQDLIPPDYSVVDKRISNKVEIPEPSFILRDSQQEIYDKCEGNCLILGDVGFGKTITALSLFHKFKEKTLILVHTQFLLDQWIQEIKMHFGIQAGILKAQKKEVNNPIVVATIQTAIRNIDIINSANFGMIIIDEAHHIPTSTFTKVLNKNKAKIKIGLTATINRKDGFGTIIPDYISQIYFQPALENTLTPEVHIFHSDIDFPVAESWTDKITKLIDNEEYVHLLYTLCKVYEERGHKVLLVSDRLALLNELYELLPSSILITSSTKDRDEELEPFLSGNTFNIILGSINIFKEGINIPPLSCLILGVQVSGNDLLLQQVIGRIRRKHKNKLQPVVVDVFLSGGSAYSQTQKRYAHYQNRGYNISNFYT